MTYDPRWHSHGMRGTKRPRGPQPHLFDLPLAVIDEYRDGATCQRLADKYGCSKNKVMYFLHDHDVEMRPKPVPATRDDLPAYEIIDLYQSGWTFAEIAELYNASISAIWTRVPREGRRGPTRPSEPAPDDEHVPIDLERVRDMLSQGMSLDAIGVDLDVETDSLREVLKNYGVRIPARADPDDPKRVQQREQARERAQQERDRAIALEYQHIRQRDLKEERARLARAEEYARRQVAALRYAAIREGEIEFERRERSQLRDWLAQHADILTGEGSTS